MHLSRPRSLRDAYTLMEVLIVVVLVAIITAFTLPRINYMSYRMDANARAIRSALQRAQAAAVAGQHNMVVSIDPGHERLAILSDNNNNLVADPGETITYVSLQDGAVFGVPLSTWAGAPLPTASMTGAQLQTVNGLSSFVFRGDGAASSDAEIYITTARNKPADQRGVNVVQATGHVDGYHYTGSTWQRAGF